MDSRQERIQRRWLTQRGRAWKRRRGRFSPRFSQMKTLATSRLSWRYLLKPSPKKILVSSTLLWSRVLKERRRRSDRLRWWLSLLLAATIGLLMALALGRPELGAPREGRRYALVRRGGGTAFQDGGCSSTVRAVHRQNTRSSYGCITSIWLGVPPWEYNQIWAGIQEAGNGAKPPRSARGKH